MRAPSLYKHFPTKRAVEAALIEEGMVEFGRALHAALRGRARGGAVRNLLEAYRRAAAARPALYRLATSGCGRASHVIETGRGPGVGRQSP